MKNNLTSVIALDVGGSSVKSGLVNSGGSVYFVNHTPINSQTLKEDVLQVFVKIIQMYLRKVNPNEFIGIAFGFPGPFDYENGLCLIQGQSKYDDLYQVNIRDELKKLLDFDKPILFCNDAEAAVIGEANYGAGKDFDRVIGITLGTGLGAAFIVNGVSVHDGQGIPSNAELFPLKFKGKRADDLFSTRGLIERFHKRGFYYSNVAEATEDIKQGNTSLISVFQKFGEDLGQFLLPFVDDFGADVLLVLGGISGAIEYFHREVEDQLNIPVFPGRSQNAALLGAADLLLT
ncbi:MAG: ROK family protein [Desulfobacteraceae bacterium]|nr:ROK family protein [Desulfobacteraceae bacterium]